MCSIPRYQSLALFFLQSTELLGITVILHTCAEEVQGWQHRIH